MIASLTAAWSRPFAVLGRISMYRLMVYALSVLTLVALLVSALGMVLPTPGELLATLAVLLIVSVAVDVAAHLLLRLPVRIESSLITAPILLFVLWPTLEPAGLAGIALAAATASASKYVIAWRGRHLLNPAAAGATVIALCAALGASLGTTAWWVGADVLFAPVLLVGLVVLWRVEKVRVVAVFWIAALAVSVLHASIQYAEAGIAIDYGTVVWQLVVSSPILFLGAFMLSEPLTLPSRRWQQYVVALVVAALVGWPPVIGDFVFGAETALLVGNVVAFALGARSGIRLRLRERRVVAPGVTELAFETRRPLRFVAGQYLELTVPHRRPDARGTRRELSIVSAPEDAPLVRVAYRDATATPSTYKRALASLEPGGVLTATGVWGDFTLRAGEPLLLVAAGIGVTPFVSQLRHLAATGERRDIVVVYVASGAAQLVFRDDIAAAGVPVVVVTPEDPGPLPDGWRWAGGHRLDAASLGTLVPDLAARHAYVSGPPALIADLAPALSQARSLTTDAFAGY
ncbi:FAD-dependent oxidoreductase [Microbacterium sp.]|uniref:FAD-dependent oxidoreductase n=1 Tax=Microbacterium sp. TaxID=51671 RepID=UPI0039E71181